MSASSIAWIGSVESFLLLFVGVITGPLFDARYFYILLPFGCFMVTFGYMMTSFGTEYYQIMLAQDLCVGISTGCLFVAAVAVLPQYFEKKKALANGIAATGPALAASCTPSCFIGLSSRSAFHGRLVLWDSSAWALVPSPSQSCAFGPRRDKNGLCCSCLLPKSWNTPSSASPCFSAFWAFTTSLAMSSHGQCRKEL